MVQFAILLFLVCLSIGCSGSSGDSTSGNTDTQQSDNTTSTGVFQKTDAIYTINDNMDSICQQTFGSDYRLADWEDIVENYMNGLSADDILSEGHAYVSDNGEEFWSGDRHFIASRNNHAPHAGYLSHDNIDDHLKYAGSESDYPGNVTTVLYLDTDKNASTGMSINGIGADVRLADTGSNNTLTSGYCQWNNTSSSWEEVITGSAGSADDTISVDGGAHVYVAIYGSNSLLNTAARGVLAIEILTTDNSGTAHRYDATDSFDISAF